MQELIEFGLSWLAEDQEKALRETHGLYLVSYEEILKTLPHRGNAMKLTHHEGCILCVPRDLRSHDVQVFANKFVTKNDPDLDGHFPGEPVYPGHALRECVNLAVALTMLAFSDLKGLPVAREEGPAKFRTKLMPGNGAVIHATLLELKRDRRATTATFIGEVRMLDDKRSLVASFGESKGVLM